MGKVGGFLEHARVGNDKEPAVERVGHWREFERRLPVLVAREQGARCMSCGVPTCHSGCPLGNRIPDWNDRVHKDRWHAALAALEATNPMPEVTGRVCPAPCEAACVLELAGAPVSIKALEREIADRGWDEGWFVPQRPAKRTGRSVAVVGSGPAGLACAQQLARAGHEVTVLERDDRLGGLLRYGIPDFKLDKTLVDRRVALLRDEGVSFRTGVELGRDVTLAALKATYDAVVLATGSTVPRELEVTGRSLRGVHQAMDYLVRANRRAAGDAVPHDPALDVRGKRIVILGGGDTGSDCLGTALREGAHSVLQLELAPRPPEARGEQNPWPWWPAVWRVSSSQQEGGVRDFAVRTTELRDDGAGHVCGLRAERVGGGEALAWEAELVLLAMGFAGAQESAWQGSGVALDARGRVREETSRFTTGEPGVFACGDARRGQSLVVWALWEGREAARTVDAALMGTSALAEMPEARGL